MKYLYTALAALIVLISCGAPAGEETPDAAVGPDAAGLADFLGPYSDGVRVRRPPPYRMAQ